MEKDDLILWAKKKEMEALERSGQPKDDPRRYNYFQGKAGAFSEIWETLVFDGKTVCNGGVHPNEYNKANDFWSKKVNDSL